MASERRHIYRWCIWAVPCALRNVILSCRGEFLGFALRKEPKPLMPKDWLGGLDSDRRPRQAGRKKDRILKIEFGPWFYSGLYAISPFWPDFENRREQPLTFQTHEVPCVSSWKQGHAENNACQIEVMAWAFRSAPMHPRQPHARLANVREDDDQQEYRAYQLYAGPRNSSQDQNYRIYKRQTDRHQKYEGSE